jgi:hypothetical protein
MAVRFRVILVIFKSDIAIFAPCALAHLCALNSIQKTLAVFFIATGLFAAASFCMDQLLILLSNSDPWFECLWVTMFDSFDCLLPRIFMLFDIVAVVAVAVVAITAVSETLTVKFETL